KVRQEMGQDIAGACGQLALTAPSAAQGSSEGGNHGSGLVQDIEDLMNANQRRQPQSKPTTKKQRHQRSLQNQHAVNSSDDEINNSDSEKTLAWHPATTWVVGVSALAVLAIVGLRTWP